MEDIVRLEFVLVDIVLVEDIALVEDIDLAGDREEEDIDPSAGYQWVMDIHIVLEIDQEKVEMDYL